MSSYIIVSTLGYNNRYDTLYTNNTEDIKKIYLNCISFVLCRIKLQFPPKGGNCDIHPFRVMIENLKECDTDTHCDKKYDMREYPFIRYSNGFQPSNDIHINKTIEVNPGHSLFIVSNAKIQYSIEIKEL